MRFKMQLQQTLDFHLSNLKITNDYYATYEKISQVLDKNPKLINLIHRDLVKALKDGSRNDRGAGRVPSNNSGRIGGFAVRPAS